MRKQVTVQTRHTHTQARQHTPTDTPEPVFGPKWRLGGSRRVLCLKSNGSLRAGFTAAGKSTEVKTRRRSGDHDHAHTQKKKTRSGHVRGGGSAPPGPRASALPHVSPKYWERSGCGRRRSSSIDPPSKISRQSSDIASLSKQTRSVCARLPNVSGVSSDSKASAMLPLRIRRAEGRRRLRRGGGAGWCRRSGLGLRSVTAILQTRLVLFAR